MKNDFNFVVKNNNEGILHFNLSRFRAQPKGELRGGKQSATGIVSRFQLIVQDEKMLVKPRKPLREMRKIEMKT